MGDEYDSMQRTKEKADISLRIMLILEIGKFFRWYSGVVEQ